MCQLLPLWPGRESHGPTRSTKAKLPQWRGEDPEPSLESSDFKVGVSKTKLKRLLSEFRNNSCPYTDGKSCWKEAVGVEKHHQKLSKNFQLLMRRRSSWKKNDLESLFDLAHTYGQAAKFHRPAFSRQRPKKVSRSIAYLLTGNGDPFVRFEKVLAAGSPYKLKGMAEAGLAFLMHLWSPKDFAIVNKPVDKALRMLKVSFGRAASSRKGQGYKDRTAAIGKVKVVTGLKSLARVDRFLDAVSKPHIGP